MKTQMLLILFQPDTYIWACVAVLALLTLTVCALCRRRHRRRLTLTCLIVLAVLWMMLLYGTFVGVRQLEVRHVEYVSADLPDAFDGYRIVQFSDAHVPSYTGWRQPLLLQAVDSINAQRPDLIAFTGDLQNKQPSDITPHSHTLKRLRAADGVCAILGNHDYAMYTGSDDPQLLQCNRLATISQEEALGWTVLTNSHRTIRRGSDSIVIAGMENDGEGRFPQLGDISQTLQGVDKRAFTVMLEHDPTSWRRKILPQSHCQLTLSGHTHGGQVSLFGWSPAMLAYSEPGGAYYMDSRAMIVSTGLSGVIPIRIGVKPEIVVITLKKK